MVTLYGKKRKLVYGNLSNDWKNIILTDSQKIEKKSLSDISRIDGDNIGKDVCDVLKTSKSHSKFRLHDLSESLQFVLKLFKVRFLM